MEEYVNERMIEIGQYYTGAASYYQKKNDIIEFDFYVNFEKELTYADEKIEKVEFEDEPIGELCEKYSKPARLKNLLHTLL